MHADRVLGDGSWTRGKRQEARMSLVTSGCPRVRTPSLNHAAWQKWRRSTFPAQVTTCARSPQRVPAPRNVDDARPPNPRWASADLSLGPAYKSRPGLIEVPSSAGGSANVSSREVSTDGGSTARRRLNRSITSPYESIVDSTCRPPLKSPLPFLNTQPFIRSF